MKRTIIPVATALSLAGLALIALPAIAASPAGMTTSRQLGNVSVVTAQRDRSTSSATTADQLLVSQHHLRYVYIAGPRTIKLDEHGGHEHEHGDHGDHQHEHGDHGDHEHEHGDHGDHEHEHNGHGDHEHEHGDHGDHEHEHGDHGDHEHEHGDHGDHEHEHNGHGDHNGSNGGSH